MKYNREYAAWIRDRDSERYINPPRWLVWAESWLRQYPKDFRRWHKWFCRRYGFSPAEHKSMHRYIKRLVVTIPKYKGRYKTWRKRHDAFDLGTMTERFKDGRPEVTRRLGAWYRLWRRGLINHLWPAALPDEDRHNRYARYRESFLRQREQSASVVEKLTALEQARDLRPVDMASLLGISRSHYANIKAGRRPLTGKLRRLLNRKLGLDIEYWF